MERFSLRERIVFEMKHYQGLKLRAIGDALCTTEETVKNSLFRATRKLHQELGGLRCASLKRTLAAKTLRRFWFSTPALKSATRNASRLNHTPRFAGRAPPRLRKRTNSTKP